MSRKSNQSISLSSNTLEEEQADNALAMGVALALQNADWGVETEADKEAMKRQEQREEDRQEIRGNRTQEDFDNDRQQSGNTWVVRQYRLGRPVSFQSGLTTPEFYAGIKKQNKEKGEERRLNIVKSMVNALGMKLPTEFLPTLAALTKDQVEVVLLVGSVHFLPADDKIRGTHVLGKKAGISARNRNSASYNIRTGVVGFTPTSGVKVLKEKGGISVPASAGVKALFNKNKADKPLGKPLPTATGKGVLHDLSTYGLGKPSKTVAVNPPESKGSARTRAFHDTGTILRNTNTVNRGTGGNSKQAKGPVTSLTAVELAKLQENSKKLWMAERNCRFYFERGYCKSGSACLFSHALLPPKAGETAEVVEKAHVAVQEAKESSSVHSSHSRREKQRAKRTAKAKPKAPVVTPVTASVDDSKAVEITPPSEPAVEVPPSEPAVEEELEIGYSEWVAINDESHLVAEAKSKASPHFEEDKEGSVASAPRSSMLIGAPRKKAPVPRKAPTLPTKRLMTVEEDSDSESVNSSIPDSISSDDSDSLSLSTLSDADEKSSLSLSTLSGADEKSLATTVVTSKPSPGKGLSLAGKIPAWSCIESCPSQTRFSPITHLNTLPALVSFDQGGSPYCGPTAVYVASGVKKLTQELVCSHMGGMSEVECGTPDALIGLAFKLGVNITLHADDLSSRETIHWKSYDMIHLLLTRSKGGGGHWTVLGGDTKVEVAAKLDLPATRTSTWSNPVGSTKQFRIVSVHSPLTDIDQRNALQKRDAVKHGDMTAVVEITRGFRFPFLTTVFQSSSLPGRFLRRPRDTLRVSVQRFLVVWLEAVRLHHAGRDPMIAAGLIHGMTNINTPSEVSLYQDTHELLRQCVKELLYGNTAGVKETIKSLEAYNTPNNTAIVSALDIVRDNQSAGPRQVKAFEKNPSASLVGSYSNHLKLQIPLVPEEAVAGKVVRVAPVGAPSTLRGAVMGPGAIAVTDRLGVAVAIGGRQMNKVAVETEATDEFVDYCLNFFSKIINDGHMDVGSEPDPVEAYRKLYAGKKPVVLIESVVAMYNEYKETGLAHPDLFKHKLFNKDENNIKEVGGELHARPRGIGTQSPEQAVEVSPLHILMEWMINQLSAYHVKGLTPEQMVSKVQSRSEGDSEGTDYSAFESSASPGSQRVERGVLLMLCDKAGWLVTKQALIKHSPLWNRMLYKGLLAWIATRISGFLWTAFGNFVLNLSVNLFNHYTVYKNLDTFEILCEGDDGFKRHDPAINGAALSAKLGFFYSSASVGHKPGDVCFLQCRWMGGFRLLNVGRMMKAFWVRGANLRRGKQLWLLRCSGMSLWWLSPGHPILMSLVARIGRLTAGSNPFRGWRQKVDMWNKEHIDFEGSYPRGSQLNVNQQMRDYLVEGAEGFPPIAEVDQRFLETQLDDDSSEFYTRGILDEYSDFRQCVEHEGWKNPDSCATSPSVAELCKIVNVSCEKEDGDGGGDALSVCPPD